MAMRCCEVTAGKLRHPISIERKVSAPDGVGGVELTWESIIDLRAAIDPVSGNERFAAQRIEADVTHRLLFRWFDGLRASDRINFKGRLFNIRLIRNLEEKNRIYEVTAVEGVGQ